MVRKQSTRYFGAVKLIWLNGLALVNSAHVCIRKPSLIQPFKLA